MKRKKLTVRATIDENHVLRVQVDAYAVRDLLKLMNHEDLPAFEAAIEAAIRGLTRE